MKPVYPEKRMVEKKRGPQVNERGSGILLHITSLPSPFGIGDLGPSAYRFVDFLSATCQKYWQVLPLNPTLLSGNNSPYLSSSAFAGNTNLISPELMVRDGLLDPVRQDEIPEFPDTRANFTMVTRYKKALFSRAFDASFETIRSAQEFREFCQTNTLWLDDYVLFKALAGRFRNHTWSSWPRGVKFRNREAMKAAAEKLHVEIEREKFLQYVFFTQWERLRGYCRRRGIALIGDMPIYVSYQSADVWANPELFLLGADLKPTVVAGVPPDYFSRSGQLWKNPLYRWEQHERTAFAWWIQRLGWNISLFDRVRIDHFRGLVAYWEVPAGSVDATRGRWVRAPAGRLLDALKRETGLSPIIAEDLGLITPDVKAVLRKYRLPGMRVLQFAFTGRVSKSPHAPENLQKNTVLYTGTHDNAPIRGWFDHCADREEKKRVSVYLCRDCSPEELPWVFISLVLMSSANTVIIPMQDILGLGMEARMNTPGTVTGNWRWRITGTQMEGFDRDRLRDMTRGAGRV